MSKPISIIAIPGSLRKASLGRALLGAVTQAFPDTVSFNLLEAGDLPIYDADVEPAWGDRLQELKSQVSAADGILVCSPEYNGSYSGHVKNTIDWLSRDGNVFSGKPSAAITVSGGVSGGVNSNNHLRSVLLHLGSPYMAVPRINVASAASSFDAENLLTDKVVQKRINSFVPAFVEWVTRFAE